MYQINNRYINLKMIEEISQDGVFLSIRFCSGYESNMAFPTDDNAREALESILKEIKR